MTREENRAFMKDFFEKYYEKQKARSESCVAGVKIPEEMVAYDLPTGGGWKVWKLFPSTVTDEDIQALEDLWNVKLPECLCAFLSTYHHRFDGLIGRNDIGKPFWSILNAYNPHLAANGYIPFGWDEDNYFIRCIDITNAPDDEKCPVVQIAHEVLFDLYDDDDEELLPKEALAPHIEKVAKNFYEYLNAILKG